MTIHVKNILSDRSKDLIYSELRKAGLEFVLRRKEQADTLEVIFPLSGEKGLYAVGLEPLGQKERKKVLIKNVKAEILNLIYFSAEPLAINLSVYLSEKFSYDYTYLAKLFSNQEGFTIERFLIGQKIDRVKQLLRNDALTVTDIATLMHYSSISHLSTQFKKVTGITTSQFRKTRAIVRIDTNP